ncbi:MAG: hypothetical protein ACLQNG_05675 [Acidimicrobiales bacterium]|jgi:hypothetical protein
MWEYLALSEKDMRTDDSGGPLTVQQKLEVLGKDGWELVAFHPEEFWVFKKPAEPEKARARAIELQQEAERAHLARKDPASWEPPVF